MSQKLTAISYIALSCLYSQAKVVKAPPSRPHPALRSLSSDC